jgi:DNA-binding response OmpR family regulator
MTLPSCSPHTALVVEDDPSIRRLLKRSLGPSFTVDTANDSHFAKECLFHKRFDLTLLDIGLPDGSGLQLCQMIKADVYMRHMPVIFVSGMGAISDRIDGINIGADDYITKPFSPAELLARSEAAVRKSIINLEANPLTLLPGNGTIEREIYRQIQSGRVFSVLYIDINNFKAYNDYYGFLRGDGVIRRSGELLVESIHGSSDTVGHIGGG